MKLEQEEGDLESEEFSQEDLPEEYSDEMGEELEDDEFVHNDSKEDDQLEAAKLDGPPDSAMLKK